MTDPANGTGIGTKSAIGLGCILMGALGLLQIGAGYAGIDATFGTGWAVAALAAALMLKFPLPLTIGAFFCARDIWGWHWIFAIAFAMPGLVFLVPGLIASVMDRGRR